MEEDFIIESYKTDGEYSYEVYSFEDIGEDKDHDSIISEGWVLVNGSKGNYNYDLENLLLTINYSQVFGDDPSTPQSNYVWYNIVTNTSDQYFDPDKIIKESYNCIFFQHKMIDDVFLFQSEKVYMKESNLYYADNRIKNETLTYDFSKINAIELTNIYFIKDKDNNILSGEKSLAVFDIYKYYPTEALFENGDTISFYYQSADYTYYDWSNNSWELNNEITEKYYMCLGTFVTSKDKNVVYKIDEYYYRNK
jgi:hypothetical protein